MPNLKKRKSQEVFTPKQLVLGLIKEGKVGSLADKLSNDEINAILESFTTMKQAKAKGGNISSQMEMFEEGGLKDEGGTVDPISGNDVPSGSTQEEVRDDIPAQLSEGEFVFPADVVRYLGLEKLMTLRQEAKQGLKTMEDMGQMGNSEEATMRDDMPFDINDIDMDDDEEYNSEDMEMARGGVVYAATGFGGTTTSNNQLGSRASSFGNTATRTPQPKTYTPPPIPTAAPAGGFTYGKPKEDGQGKLTFDNLFKETGAADEYKTYVNDAGAEIQVPFKNGKLLTGFTIPEGYKLKTEKVDTAKIQSTGIKTARVEDTSGGDGSTDPSSASLSFGGKSDGKGGQIGGITVGLEYNINPFGLGGVFGGLATINDIGNGKTVNTLGNKNGLTTKPVTMTFGKSKVSLTSKQYASIKNNPTGPEAKALTSRIQVLNAIASNPYGDKKDFLGFDPKTNTYVDKLGNSITTEQAQQAGKDIQDQIAQEVSQGRDATKSLASRSQTEISVAQDYGITDEDDKQSYSTTTAPSLTTSPALSASTPSNYTPNNDDGPGDDNNNSDDTTHICTATYNNGYINKEHFTTLRKYGILLRRNDPYMMKAYDMFGPMLASYVHKNKYMTSFAKFLTQYYKDTMDNKQLNIKQTVFKFISKNILRPTYRIVGWTSIKLSK